MNKEKTYTERIYFFPYPKKYSQPQTPKTLSKKRTPTGELILFKQIFLKKNGKCQITGNDVIFDPMSFLHILSKGAFPRFRLYEKNILLVEPEIHWFYDNAGHEKLLFEYPKAQMIYDLKEELKIEYHLPKHTI